MLQVLVLECLRSTHMVLCIYFIDMPSCTHAERVITKIWKQMHGLPDANSAEAPGQEAVYDAMRER